MREVWRRIEAVLQATAPDLRAALAPGASAQATASAANRLGIALPDDVCESYALHDGSGEAGILPQNTYGTRTIGVPLLSLHEVIRDWQMWLDSLNRGSFDPARAAPEGPIRAHWW